MEKQIIQMESGENILYPQTVSDAVLVGEKTLSELLEGIDDTPVIDGDSQTGTFAGLYAKTLEGGKTICSIYKQVVTLKNVTPGSRTITIQAADNILEDYFIVHNNGTFTISNISIDGMTATVTLNFTGSFDVITIPVEYATSDLTYDYIEVKIPSTNTNPVASIATTKYNKGKWCLLSSDDGGNHDFTYDWMKLNGHPVHTDKSGVYYGKHGVDLLVGGNGDVNDPYVITDGVGSERRMALSLGITHLYDHMYADLSYEGIDGREKAEKYRFDDIDIMRTTGAATDFHDHYVDDEYLLGEDGLKDTEKCIREYNEYSEKASRIVANATVANIGVKTWIIPTGNKELHTYGTRCTNLCMVCDQNADNYTDAHNNVWTNFRMGTDLVDVVSGEDVTSFSKIPKPLAQRWFEMTLAQYVDRKSNFIVVPFSHSIHPNIWQILDDIKTNDDRIVCSFDEFWEYYHLYNHTKITKCVGDGTTVTIGMKVPRYQCNQFRELTINVNLSDGGSAQSDSKEVYGLRGRQNSDQYTFNVCLEEQWVKNAEFFLEIGERHTDNQYVKRDCLYLINLLKDGADKDRLMQKYNTIYN